MHLISVATLTTIADEKLIPIHIVPAHTAIFFSQQFMSIEQRQLEKEGMTKDTKEVGFVQSHCTYDIEPADLARKVVAASLKLSATFTDQVGIVFL